MITGADAETIITGNTIGMAGIVAGAGYAEIWGRGNSLLGLSFAVSIVFLPAVTSAIGRECGCVSVGFIAIGRTGNGKAGSAVFAVLLNAVLSVLDALSFPVSVSVRASLVTAGAFFVRREDAAPVGAGGPLLWASKDANNAASGSLPGGLIPVAPKARPFVIPPAKANGPAMMSGGILTSFMGCWYYYRKDNLKTRGLIVVRS